MKIADDERSHSTVEVVKKCSKCGEEYSLNFTPRDETDWRVIYENIGTDGTCPKCSYSSFEEYVRSVQKALPTCGVTNCIAGRGHKGYHIFATFGGGGTVGVGAMTGGNGFTTTLRSN